jgi:protein tyrosine/serine phosphatase
LTSNAPPPAARPAAWAAPLNIPALPNAFQVSPTLYRGAQPEAAGMRELQRLGVKTVINLRAFHSDRDEIGTNNLALENIPMKTWHPEKEQVVRFLALVTDTNRAPLFVHCQHGADRTGLMCAIYRVTVCGWTKPAAVAEMTGGGFGFHPVWTNLVVFFNGLDLDAIRKESGAK